MKGVNDVRVAQRLQEDQFVVRRPSRAGGDDRVLWRAFANRSRQFDSGSPDQR